MDPRPLDFDVLEPSSNEGYGNWPLPCHRDSEIGRLVPRLVADRPPLEREHAQVLLAFAERMASLARTEGSIERLRSGVLAAALAGTVGDARDALLVLPLLWKSAVELGGDPAMAFRLASEQVGGVALLEFAARPAEDRTIEAMGYIEVEDEFGFHYERTW